MTVRGFWPGGVYATKPPVEPPRPMEMEPVVQFDEPQPYPQAAPYNTQPYPDASVQPYEPQKPNAQPPPNPQSIQLETMLTTIYERFGEHPHIFNDEK